MSERVEVTDATYQGVSVNHPQVIEYARNLKKQGVSKERAAQIIGMPIEVIDKHYQD